MMTRTQILIPDDLLHEVRWLAAAQKVSVSAIARKGMRDQVQKAKGKKQLSGAEVLLEMAKHAYTGKVPKDFSTNDEYLYGKYGPK